MDGGDCITSCANRSVTVLLLERKTFRLCLEANAFAVISTLFQKMLANTILRMPELSCDIWCKLHYYEKARTVARFYSSEWNLTVNSSSAKYNGHV